MQTATGFARQVEVNSARLMEELQVLSKFTSVEQLFPADLEIDATTQSLLDLLDRPQVRTGEVDTGWLDRMMADGYRPPHRLDVALLAVAVEAQDEHAARQREQLFASAERGRPEVGHETWHQIDVRAGGEAYRLRVAQTRGNRYRVELEGVRVDVTAERIGRFERRLAVADTTYAVLVAPRRIPRHIPAAFDATR